MGARRWSYRLQVHDVVVLEQDVVPDNRNGHDCERNHTDYNGPSFRPIGDVLMHIGLVDYHLLIEFDSESHWEDDAYRMQNQKHDLPTCHCFLVLIKVVHVDFEGENEDFEEEEGTDEIDHMPLDSIDLKRIIFFSWALNIGSYLDEDDLHGVDEISSNKEDYLVVEIDG